MKQRGAEILIVAPFHCSACRRKPASNILHTQIDRLLRRSCTEAADSPDNVFTGSSYTVPTVHATTAHIASKRVDCITGEWYIYKSPTMNLHILIILSWLCKWIILSTSCLLNAYAPWRVRCHQSCTAVCAYSCLECYSCLCLRK